MGRRLSLWALAAVLVFPLLASACKCNDEPPPSPIPPDVEEAVRAYFGAWEAGDFEEMFAFMTAEEERTQDFAEDMSFAPVTPKNVEILGVETLSANRVRVEYSLDLAKLGYIVGGLIVRNPARYDPGCVTLNEKRTSYTSYEDFLVLEREGPDAPWSLDEDEGNTLAKAISGMARGFLFQLTYRSEFPSEPAPPEFTDPTSPEFDKHALISSLAVYGVERDLEEEELTALAEPAMEYVIDLMQECE